MTALTPASTNASAAVGSASRPLAPPASSGPPPAASRAGKSSTLPAPANEPPRPPPASAPGDERTLPWSSVDEHPRPAARRPPAPAMMARLVAIVRGASSTMFLYLVRRSVHFGPPKVESCGPRYALGNRKRKVFLPTKCFGYER